MKSFSKGQLKAASEILGNIAVTWFAAGIVGPIFSKGVFSINFLLSFILAIFFIVFSILLVKDIKV